MSNVNLAIGGRTFTVACARGEEGHVTELGRMVDARITAAGSIAQNETRMLLFAALMLADEVHEARAALAEGAEAIGQSEALHAQMEARITQITQRLEDLAQLLDPAEPSST